MSRADYPNDEVCRFMAKELCEVEDGLSSWEVGFIENMSRLQTFTENQAKKLTEVYEKHL